MLLAYSEPRITVGSAFDAHVQLGVHYPLFAYTPASASGVRNASFPALDQMGHNEATAIGRLRYSLIEGQNGSDNG